jgi:site-specific recombinase XerD
MNELTLVDNTSLTPAAALSDWHAHLDLLVRAGELSKASADTYRRGMAGFVTWCEGANVQTVTQKAVYEWLATLRETYKTANAVNVRFSGVRSFYNWAAGNGLILINPTDGIKRQQRKGANNRHQRDPLTDTEVKRLLAAPNQNTLHGKRDYAILCLMLYTGIRTIEVHRANIEGLRTRSGRLVLDVRGKGSQDQPDPVVLPEAAVNPVLDWIAASGLHSGPLFISLSNRSLNERLGLRSIREMVKGYMQSVGINSERKTTHSLRHTAATKAAQHVTPYQLKILLRHTNIETSMIYYHDNERFDNPPEDYISYD